jgi:hypothetical protein
MAGTPPDASSHLFCTLAPDATILLQRLRKELIGRSSAVAWADLALRWLAAFVAGEAQAASRPSSERAGQRASANLRMVQGWLAHMLALLLNSAPPSAPSGSGWLGWCERCSSERLAVFVAFLGRCAEWLPVLDAGSQRSSRLQRPAPSDALLGGLAFRQFAPGPDGRDPLDRPRRAGMTAPEHASALPPLATWRRWLLAELMLFYSDESRVCVGCPPSRWRVV